MPERLEPARRWASAAWRGRRLGVVAAWAIWVAGWAILAQLPDGRGAAAQVAMATVQEMPERSDRARSSRAQELRRDLPPALLRDLNAARAARAEALRELAMMPATLPDLGQPNPYRGRLKTQLDQQQAVIASLEKSLASADAVRAAPPAVGGQEAARPVREGAAEPAPMDRPARSMLYVLAGLLALGSGGVLAAWRGGRAGVVETAPQLERRFAVPVLGILASVSRGPRRHLAGWSGAALDLLILASLVGTVIVINLLDLLPDLSSAAGLGQPG